MLNVSALVHVAWFLLSFLIANWQCIEYAWYWYFFLQKPKSVAAMVYVEATAQKWYNNVVHGYIATGGRLTIDGTLILNP